MEEEVGALVWPISPLNRSHQHKAGGHLEHALASCQAFHELR